MADEINSRQPDRMTVSEKVLKNVIPDIRNEAFFEGMQNADTLLYAMALGKHDQIKPELKDRVGGGYARAESFSYRFRALIDAVHFSEIGFKDADKLRDRKTAYGLAERYANGGFEIIEGDFNRRKSSEEIANDLVCEMDKMYESMFGKVPY